MVFTKTYRRRRRRFVRRRAKGLGPLTMTRRRRRRPMTAGRVKRIIDAELKVHDINNPEIAFDNLVGTIVSLSNVPQGDTNTERTGNWIKPTTLMGTITVQGVDNLATELTRGRVSIVQWRENQDADPISLDRILQDVALPHQQYNVESKGSFKILWSKVFTVINQDNNPKFSYTWRFYLRPSMKVLFDDADQRKYHLFIVASSDKVALSGDEPLMNFDTRMRYTDS